MENNKKYKRPESVLVVVYTISGYVLMMRRSFPDNFWQSVTGSLEWDEQPVQAAVRELSEETGLDAHGLIDCNFSQEFEIYSIWRHRYAPGVTRNLEHVFLMPIDDCKTIIMDTREHVEYQWLLRADAAQLASSHTNRDAILRWVPEINSTQ